MMPISPRFHAGRPSLNAAIGTGGSGQSENERVFFRRSR